MAFYNNLRDFYSLVGNSVKTRMNETMDGFLSTLSTEQKYSNAGLVINYLKSKGISGSITFNKLVSTVNYFGFINEALKLAKRTDQLDSFDEVLDEYADYTEVNRFVLQENTPLVSGGTILSWSTLKPKDESIFVEGGPYSDNNFVAHRLIANSSFNNNSNTYVQILGVITVDPGSQLGFGPSSSTFVSSDSLFDRVVTPFTAGGAVTDTGTGDVVPISFALLTLDNTLALPNEYFVFLVMANGVPFDTSVITDQTLFTNSSTISFENL